MAASPGSHAATASAPTPAAMSAKPASMMRPPPNRITSDDESTLIETEPRNCTVKARPISASLTSHRCVRAGSTGPSNVVAMPAMKNPTYRSGMEGGRVWRGAGIDGREALPLSPGSALSSCDMLQRASLLVLYGFIVLPVAVSVALLAIIWRAVTWVAEPPFVWLPSVLVLTALAGHLVIFPKLREPWGARNRCVRLGPPSNTDLEIPPDLFGLATATLASRSTGEVLAEALPPRPGVLASAGLADHSLRQRAPAL